jgi:hypothetical protein
LERTNDFDITAGQRNRDVDDRTSARRFPTKRERTIAIEPLAPAAGRPSASSRARALAAAARREGPKPKAQNWAKWQVLLRSWR